MPIVLFLRNSSWSVQIPRSSVSQLCVLKAQVNVSDSHFSTVLVITWTSCVWSAVTIARAIELKHNATLIAALAFETANYYQRAGQYFFCHCLWISFTLHSLFSFYLCNQLVAFIISWDHVVFTMPVFDRYWHRCADVPCVITYFLCNICPKWFTWYLCLYKLNMLPINALLRIHATVRYLVFLILEQFCFAINQGSCSQLALIWLPYF